MLAFFRYIKIVSCCFFSGEQRFLTLDSYPEDTQADDTQAALNLCWPHICEGILSHVKAALGEHARNT